MNLELPYHHTPLLEGQLPGELLVAEGGNLHTPDIEPSNVPGVTLNGEAAVTILPTCRPRWLSQVSLRADAQLAEYLVGRHGSPGAVPCH